jgi:MFS family permease
MTDSSPTQARWAVASIFLFHGLLVGAWVPHIALAKERLAVDHGVFGVALLALAAGAVCAMPLAGALINRLGSAPLTLATGMLFCLTFLGPVTAPNLVSFALTGFLMGAMIGSMDVAMNAHGIAVEKTLRLPTMSMFHGAFSVGGMTGAFVGAAVLKLLNPLAQALGFAAFCCAAILIACRFLLPASVDKGLSGSHFGWPTRATIGLGLLCFLALMAEGSTLDWVAIMLREKFGVSASLAALAFGVYQGGMSLSRLTGDWLRQRMGAVRLVQVSGILAACGTAAALIAPSVYLSIAAFLVAGLGIGNIAPVLFAGGGRLEPQAPGRGIAAVTTLGYAGFMSGPPVIGFAAQLSNLTVALFITVAGALVITAFARTVDAADTF